MTKDRFDDDQLDAQATEYARGDYPAGTLYFDGTPLDSFATPLRSFVAGIGTGLHAWAEGMARAAAVARFRAWTDGAHDERPTRSELRGDGALVLDELDRVAALAAKRGAAVADADKDLADVRKDLAAASREVDALRAQRDDAVRERDQWVNEHATVVESFDQLAAKRDALAAQRDSASEALDEMTAQARAGDDAVRVAAELRSANRRLMAQRDRMAQLARRRRENLAAASCEVEALRAQFEDGIPTAEDVAAGLVHKLAADPDTIDASAEVGCDRSIRVTVTRVFSPEQFRRSEFARKTPRGSGAT